MELSPLGSGTSWAVEALAVFDDGQGGGPALYAGGGFSSAGGVPASRSAKWDGSSWSAVGGGLTGAVSPWVTALVVFDDGLGGGPALYAGGSFTHAGGVPASRIAKWDGVSWSAVGGGMGEVNPYVRALAVFDDGSGGGPALYAGGTFTTAGGLAADRIAKWDGVAWAPVSRGMDNDVLDLTVFNDGSGGGPALYAGGRFGTAGGQRAGLIAKWGCEATGCYADCDGSAALDFFDFLCFQNEFLAGCP
jgi:trimeric autotransporter adhesin